MSKAITEDSFNIYGNRPIYDGTYIYTIGMRNSSPNQTLKQQLTDYVNRYGMYDSYNDI